MACFVTGSPMIEQLQPRGGTENVFLIMVDMMNSCYRPSPSGRKQRSFFWSYLRLNGPNDFRIEQRPSSFLTAKPHEESRAGAVGAKDFDIQQRIIVAEVSRHAREGQTVQHVNWSPTSHCNWTGQGNLRLFEPVPRGEPVTDTKVKSSFEPAWLPVDRDEFPDQVLRQLAIEIPCS